MKKKLLIFSTVVFLGFLFMLSIWTVSGSKIERKPSKNISKKREILTRAENEYEKKYFDYLEKHSLYEKREEKEYKKRKIKTVYSMDDIDGDGIPEMIYGPKDEFVHAPNIWILMIKNGDVKQMGPFGEYGSLTYIPKKNRLVLEDITATGVYCNLVELDGSKDGKSLAFGYTPAKFQEDYEKYHWEEEYSIDGKKCTREEFDALWKKALYDNYTVFECKESESVKVLNIKM